MISEFQCGFISFLDAYDFEGRKKYVESDDIECQTNTNNNLLYGTVTIVLEIRCKI